MNRVQLRKAQDVLLFGISRAVHEAVDRGDLKLSVALKMARDGREYADMIGNGKGTVMKVDKETEAFYVGEPINFNADEDMSEGTDI